MVPVRCISSIRHMYATDFAYDGPFFLVPLSLSYPSSPVFFSDCNSRILSMWDFEILCFVTFSAILRVSRD